MRRRLFISAIAAATLLSYAQAKEPVVMTINNKDVKLSEFEYLYNKNNLQQQKKQSIDEYKDIFILYKLKVADAEAAGIDTTRAFINEFNGYRNELAQPYLEDKEVEDRLAREAYDRMKEDVDVSHIMVSLEDPETKSIFKQQALIDSIRQCAINGEDFATLATKYSIDPSVKKNQGHMGFVPAGRLPYSFEFAAYNTPIGSISDVVRTDYGFHVIKVNARRPSKGQVHVEHIMKLIPRGAAPEIAQQKKAQIDSIYQLVIGGANFEEIAKRDSDDPGSARKGGELPWFGVGEMVKEFENVAFALENGTISEPFATAYGYHFIKKLDSRGIDKYENLENTIKSQIAQDERANMAKKGKIDILKKEYKYAVNPKTIEFFNSEIAKNNGVDSLFMSKHLKSKKVIFTYADQKVPASEVMAELKKYGNLATIGAQKLITTIVGDMSGRKILEYEKDQLANKYPDFRNLINEYHDGMMLYEISNQKVWDGASKDKEGLESFFKANRSKYAWNAPKYKGFVIQVTNDSVADAVNARLLTLGGDSIMRTLRNEFKKDIKIEKVLVAKGENGIVDKYAFGENVNINADKRFPIVFIAAGEIIAQPQEAADVRGAVTSDYQSLLEERWVKELKNKYPVKINNKVLNKIK